MTNRCLLTLAGLHIQYEVTNFAQQHTNFIIGYKNDKKITKIDIN